MDFKMSLTPDEYVNARLERLEKHDAMTAEKAYQNERRIEDFKTDIVAKISAINVRIEILMWGFLSVGAVLLGVVVDILFKRK
jgi:hypothetical protein